MGPFARVALVALLALAAPRSEAQSVRIGGRCMPIPEPDSMDVVLAARVRGQEGAWSAQANYTGILADEIRRRLRLPQPLAFSTYAQTRDRKRAFPGGWAGATFALARDGSLAALVVDTTALLMPLDTALFVAINAAAADSAFPPLPRHVAGPARDAGIPGHARRHRILPVRAHPRRRGRGGLRGVGTGPRADLPDVERARAA